MTISRSIASPLARPVSSPIAGGGGGGVPYADLLEQALFLSQPPTIDGLIVGEEPGRGTQRNKVAGRCVNFDGVNDYIDCGNVAAVIRSVSIRVKPNSVMARTDAVISLNATDSIHIVNGVVTLVGFSGGSNTIYVDGVIDSTVTTAWSIITVTSSVERAATAVTLGRVGAGYFSGLQADAQLFATELTASEVVQLSLLGTSALPNEPRAAWWKLDSQHPTLALDSSGNGKHGTLTNVNATVGNFFYEGADVPHSYQNDKSFTNVAGVYYPRNESDKTKDTAGNPLQFVGKCPNNARLVDSNCLTMDGTGYLAVAGLSGSETVASKGGTSTVSIAAGRINFTTGTCWDLLLSNGNHYPMAEGAGNKCYDVVNGQHGTLTSTDLVACRATKQNVYHYNATKGFSAVENWVTTSEPDSGVSTMPAVAADVEFALKLGVTGMLDCPAGATTVSYGWLQPQDARRCYASVVVKMDDGSKPVCATTSSGGDFMFVMWQGFTGGDITYDDLGDGFWRVTQYCASRNAAGSSAIYRYSTHSGKGFRASQLHAYFESGRGYVKTIGSSAPPLNLPAKTASLTVQDSVVSSPAGPYHNLSESKIDLTQGVAHPGSAGLPTALDPLPEPTNPLFRRLRTMAGVNVAADRIVRYSEVLTGDRLLGVQKFTETKEV